MTEHEIQVLIAKRLHELEMRWHFQEPVAKGHNLPPHSNREREIAYGEWSGLKNLLFRVQNPGLLG